MGSGGGEGDQAAPQEAAIFLLPLIYPLPREEQPSCSASIPCDTNAPIDHSLLD